MSVAGTENLKTIPVNKNLLSMIFASGKIMSPPSIENKFKVQLKVLFQISTVDALLWKRNSNKIGRAHV